MSGITGGFAELDAMIDALDPAKLRSDLHKAVAEEVARVAEAQYAAGEGPSGAEWPLNRNGRFPSLRRLTAGIEFHATDDGIAGSGDDILRYHSPRSAAFSHLDRPTFPPRGQLSTPWGVAADVAAERLFAERFGRR